ncbi:hypothetical protein HMPREF9555_01955 [Selenomonas artemidis F0399]|uniref:Uncharacterized protein n=1 Tax=Selenomonas artemidis F0399 TaxID=749551 RepID=E7N4L1_9FIRM|nr:hypothetical protein HMPREF9555_01955 [Selenomonas artemidis F0399]
MEDRKAEAYRKLYINKYIDTYAEDYKEYIEDLYPFSDGLRYMGYLWDFLKSPTFIHEEQIEEYRKILKKVLIFWDNHSKDLIYIKDYWKFGKKTMVRVDYNLFLDHAHFFPEDVYLTDETLQWTIVFTHEDDINNRRLIMQVGL